MRNRLTRETERVRNLYPHGSKRERIKVKYLIYIIKYIYIYILKPFYNQFIQLGLPFT
jgi:hypothetical protein